PMAHDPALAAGLAGEGGEVAAVGAQRVAVDEEAGAAGAAGGGGPVAAGRDDAGHPISAARVQQVDVCATHALSFFSPSPSGEGLGWGSATSAVSARHPPPPSPPLKGRGFSHHAKSK